MRAGLPYAEVSAVNVDTLESVPEFVRQNGTSSPLTTEA